MQKAKKVFSFLVFIAVLSVMIVPTAFAGTIANSQSVSWSCTTWVDGNQSGTYHIFDKGRVELHADYKVSPNSGVASPDGTYGVSVQLSRVTSNCIKDFGTWSDSVAVTKGTDTLGHIATAWNTDALSSQYFYTFSVTSRNFVTFSGTGTTYNYE